MDGVYCCFDDAYMGIPSSPLLSDHSSAHRQVQEEVVAVQHRESRLMLQPLGQVLDELGGEVVAEAGHEAAAAGEGGHAVQDILCVGFPSSPLLTARCRRR